jgi:hypothetical protein
LKKGREGEVKKKKTMVPQTQLEVFVRIVFQKVPLIPGRAHATPCS